MTVLFDCGIVLFDRESVLFDCETVLFDCETVLFDCESVLFDCETVLLVSGVAVNAISVKIEVIAFLACLWMGSELFQTILRHFLHPVGHPAITGDSLG